MAESNDGIVTHPIYLLCSATIQLAATAHTPPIPILPSGTDGLPVGSKRSVRSLPPSPIWSEADQVAVEDDGAGVMDSQSELALAIVSGTSWGRGSSDRRLLPCLSRPSDFLRRSE